MKTNWLKKDYKFCKIQESEKWRVSLAHETVNVKQRVLKIDSFPSDEQLQEILDHICTS